MDSTYVEVGSNEVKISIDEESADVVVTGWSKVIVSIGLEVLVWMSLDDDSVEDVEIG